MKKGGVREARNSAPTEVWTAGREMQGPLTLRTAVDNPEGSGISHGRAHAPAGKHVVSMDKTGGAVEEVSPIEKSCAFCWERGLYCKRRGRNGNVGEHVEDGHPPSIPLAAPSALRPPSRPAPGPPNPPPLFTPALLVPPPVSTPPPTTTRTHTFPAPGPRPTLSPTPPRPPLHPRPQPRPLSRPHHTHAQPHQAYAHARPNPPALTTTTFARRRSPAPPHPRPLRRPPRRGE